MRKLVALFFVLLLASLARAEESDLKQTVSDLSSQTGDKEKMDTLGATRVALSQIRGWLNDATNAIKEEAEQKTKRLFELVRAQLKLVDELISLSTLKQEADRVEGEIAQLGQKAAAAKGKLEEKQARIRALKMKESE